MPGAPGGVRGARRRAGAKLGWYTHALVYVLVNLFIFAISEYGFGTRRWSIYPLLGWGLGLTTRVGYGFGLNGQYAYQPGSLDGFYAQLGSSF